MCLLMLLYVGTEFAFAGWLPSYCMNKQGARLSEQAAAGTVSVFWACMTAGRLLIAFALSRAPPSEAAGARCCHPVDLLLAALVLCAAAAMAALALLDGAAALWACVAAAGLFYSAIMPTVMAYLSLKGVEAKGDSLGRLLVGASIGGIAAPSLTAQLFQSLGFGVFPVIMLVLTLAMLVAGGLVAVFSNRLLLAAKRRGSGCGSGDSSGGTSKSCIRDAGFCPADMMASPAHL
jgi:fucose permease